MGLYFAMLNSRPQLVLVESTMSANFLTDSWDLFQTKITTIFNNGEISMKDFVEEIHRKGGETDFPQLTPIENEALRLGMRRLYKIGFRAKESGDSMQISSLIHLTVVPDYLAS